MKNTLKHCLIAQNYSDAAKGIGFHQWEIHVQKIEKIIDFHSDSKQKLYWEKSTFIQKSVKSSKKENIPVFYDPSEGCIYFEFPFGQVSFHVDICYIDTKIVKVVEDYKWSGLTNSRQLLMDAYYIS